MQHITMYALYIKLIYVAGMLAQQKYNFWNSIAMRDVLPTIHRGIL